MNHFIIKLSILLFSIIFLLNAIHADAQDSPQCSLNAARNNDDHNQCGGVLRASNYFKFLTYKYQKPVKRYESCIWTLETDTTLIELNFIDTYVRLTNNVDNYLAVGFFNQSNYDSFSALTWRKLDPVNEPSIQIPGPVAFIHFVATYAWPTLGFKLGFKAGDEKESSIYNYENFFLGTEYGVFKYPPTGSEYKSNQRITIVLKPDAGLPGPGDTSSSAIFFKQIKLEKSQNCIKDSVNVYGFENTWSKSGTFCGTDLSLPHFFFTHPKNDPKIITFKSDDNEIGEGFTFFWMNFAFQ